MIRIGHSYAKDGETGHACYCARCGLLLGYEGIMNGKEYCEFDEWLYCPLCGEPLYDESEVW